MDYQILTDTDIFRLLDMRTVIEVIEESLVQQSQGNLRHPPRFHVDGGRGSMVFTAGALSDRGMGFRVYSAIDNTTVRNNQLVAVFDPKTGALIGVVIGTAIGDLRTGAIGGVAIKYLSRRDSKVLGMIGTGHQAATQLQAAVEVRKFERILVHSRNRDGRNEFAGRMSAGLGCDIQAVDTPMEVVTQSDVLICATTSTEPVFDPGWLKSGTHITTLGPRIVQKHELPAEAAVQSDLIVTDSTVQIGDFGEKYFLHPHVPLSKYVSLCDIVSGKHPGRLNDGQRSLFCSIGLAGTEVAVASHAFDLNGRLENTAM